jgi:hypothetical protein
VDLILALPGLLAPMFVARDAAAPGLARLLAAAGAPDIVPEGIGAALAPAYGVARQTDWPLASIRAAAAGLATGDGCWLGADPVNLVVGQYDVALAGAVTDLAPDETAALLATLNAHFAGDGLTFVAPRPDAWFVRTNAVPALATQPLAAARGRGLRALAPTGADAPQWTRWQHEIQMLLHEHPVNAARAARGLAVVNSVWLAEGGTAPPPQGSPDVATFAAEGSIAAALALHAGRRAHPVPGALEAALEATQAATVVAVPDTEAGAPALDRAWGGPAWRALARGRLASVRIVADGTGEAVAWRARRPGFWARVAAAPSLASLLARVAERDATA